MINIKNNIIFFIKDNKFFIKDNKKHLYTKSLKKSEKYLKIFLNETVNFYFSSYKINHNIF